MTKTSTPVFRTVTDGLAFPEGPIALADGSFLLVEIAGQTLKHVSSSGKQRVIAHLEGGPNGAAMGPDGWCYICNSGGWIYERQIDGTTRPIGQSSRRGWIERVQVSSGKVERLYNGVAGRPLNSPNDIVFDSHGGFWFTDHGKRGTESRDVGAVYYARADGSHIECVISGLFEPNGIGLSPDQTTLYVTETVTRRVLAFDLAAPGKPIFHPWPAPSGGRLVHALAGNNPLDSLAVDSAGHIVAASLNNGGIWDLAPDGSYAKHYRLPDFFTTNVCFGGPGLSTAFVTLSMSGRLVAFDWPRPGLGLHFVNDQPLLPAVRG